VRVIMNQTQSRRKSSSSNNSSSSSNPAEANQEHYEALLELRDHLVDQMRQLSGASLTSNRQPGEELADVGSDNFSQEMGLTLLNADDQRFSLIQDALQRIKEGSYGSCIDCGTEIPKGRLKAIPYAKLCIHCKEIREKNEGIPPREELEEELVE